jgi:hypothetical protein
VETLPSELAQVLRLREGVPRTYLLVGPRDKPLSDDNWDSGQNHHGQTLHKLGINDLRHIYLTQTIVVAAITREAQQKIAWSMMQSRKFSWSMYYWSTDIRELNWTICYRSVINALHGSVFPHQTRVYSTAWTDTSFRPPSPSLLEDACPQHVPP